VTANVDGTGLVPARSLACQRGRWIRLGQSRQCLKQTADRPVQARKIPNAATPTTSAVQIVVIFAHTGSVL
jgi:hypothetical protein